MPYHDVTSKPGRAIREGWQLGRSGAAFERSDAERPCLASQTTAMPGDAGEHQLRLPPTTAVTAGAMPL
jgi:hypothetical protein